MKSARLHAFLLESAERWPDRPAYLAGDVTTTYAELATRAARFARGLHERSVGRGDRVALVLDGGVEFVIAYYGALMAGATVVPLNPDTRAAVLEHALSHCAATAVIVDGPAQRHLAGAIAHGSVARSLRLVVSMGASKAALGDALDVADFSALTEYGDELWDAGAQDDDVASIVYTSGTTGPPKGVMLTHRNLVANTRSTVQYLELDHEDRVAMVLPYFYVYGSSVMHTHLAAGGSIADVGSMAFPAKVVEGIERHRCTGLSGVPSTFASLTRLNLDHHGAGTRDLSSLRYVTQAGAAMDPSLTASVRRMLPAADVFVMYGQTEAAARLSYLPPAHHDRKSGSAGIAIPGVQLTVVDKEGLEVPRGTLGEIVASGENVMLGYLDDPVATGRALRGGCLHTADIGRMDEDGYLFIVGRRSEMIKTGGHRVGPHEIEDVVARVDGVAECAVVGVPDELLGQSIAAFIVCNDGVELDAMRVKRACFQELPRFKVPSHVRFVPSLPRSNQGKLLRSVLTERFAGAA